MSLNLMDIERIVQDLKMMSKDPKKEGSNLTKKIKNEIKAGEAKLSF